MKPHEHIIMPLDVQTVEQALELVELLRNDVGVFKVGLELTNSTGIETVKLLRHAGASRIFYDAKLHDIPNTVAGAMRGIVRLGVWCVTVHTQGGAAMLKAAVEAAKTEAEASGMPRPLILGVTVLTSISEEALHNELGVASGTSMAQHVQRLALLARDCGCDGVIASPQEIEIIRKAIPSQQFLVITPGIRPAGSAKGDQARVHTPAEAMVRGASYLVIGRPIYASPDPKDAAQNIAAEIQGAWSLV